MKSITSSSSRSILYKVPLAVDRYLRRNHSKVDHPLITKLLYFDYPDEGVKLVKNFSLSQDSKKLLLIKFLVHSLQIVCGIFADQRKGKDATICKIFDDCIDYCILNNLVIPRFVTLMNMKCPPFVFNGWDNFPENVLCGVIDEKTAFDSEGNVRSDFPEPPKDMYFSFKNIPSGSSFQEVWIYSSEIETVLPSRDFSSPENKLFSQLEGTMAQNKQKLFGCAKLASKVDINFLRGMNCRIFKFISPDKLLIEGVERDNLLSDLAMWHLPKNSSNPSETLCCFDNQILTISYSLPFWWSKDYSEQFANIDDDKIIDYIRTQFSNGLSINSIETSVNQKFRASSFTSSRIQEIVRDLVPSK